ncbi:RDD family protein [Pseudoalteromonas luteoviolacea]|uniref:RDD family protein n=1 Tax=Pseudoalteromonas luteoviolacea TaxID=43657 RepID=UPI001B396908|nr:RDD family protein [Pseudoalteromonas luteoviolacea]MBQ4813488.1 RDD family protein [Pseudoalteromonas luteoviolacea]
MTSFPRAGFIRRLASLIYDALVVIAFAMLTTIVYLALVQGMVSIGWFTLEGHEDVTALIQATPALYYLRATLLVTVSVTFFAYFWTKSGQTIGMRAWRLKVQRNDGQLLSWPQAVARSLTAALGIGNLIVIIDRKHKRALQDLICKTEVVLLSKEENKKIYNSLDD